jgi:hypothetical protein
MATTTGDILAAEVLFRIAGKLTAVQIGPYLNRALNLIQFGGQYVWDVKQITVNPGAFSGNVSAPTDLDLGKDIFCNNASTATPISRITNDKDWRPDDFATFSTTEYNSYYIDSGASAPGRMRFYPPLTVSQSVVVIYHAIPAVLDGTAGTSVPWTTQWMDDLVVDLAEFEIKRISNWVGWPELEQRSLARLKEAIARFSSERMVASLVEQVQAPTPKGN